MSTVKNLLKVEDAHTDVNIEKCINLIQKEPYVLDKDDVDNLLKLLNKKTSIKFLNFLADLAKTDANRVLLSTETIIGVLLRHLEEADQEWSLQILRSLCNLCAENDIGRDQFHSSGGVEILRKKAISVLDQTDDWSGVILPACLCVQNIISDSDKLQEAFLSSDYINVLCRVILKYPNNEKIVKASISGIALLVDSDLGLEKIQCDGVLTNLFTFLKACSDEIRKFMITELFEDLAKKDTSAAVLCRNGCLHVLMELIESRNNNADDDTMKEMVDILVILTSQEEGFSKLHEEDKSILPKFISWIQSSNKQIQIAAGLALGNYARSETSCEELMKNDVHCKLIKEIDDHIDEQGYEDQFQAFSSCLRNLCIPVTSKSVLIEAGLADTAVNLVKNTGLSVQFKGLGILRFLVQNQGSLAAKLCNDEELLVKVVRLCDVTMVSSTPAEAQRLIAAIIKYANEEAPIRKMISSECLGAINSLLASDHVIMQNEGLIALIMIVANVNDCVDIIRKATCLEKTMQLLKQEGIQPQTLFNGLTFLQATVSLSGGKNLLEEHSVNEVLKSLEDHPEKIISNKVIETVSIING